MRAIGFVDTNEQFDAVTRALKAAGYSDWNIIALQGTDGIEMLKRLQGPLDGMASHRGRLTLLLRTEHRLQPLTPLQVLPKT
jgi:hypothetical protein